MLYKNKTVFDSYSFPVSIGSKVKTVMFKANPSLSGMPTITDLGRVLHCNQESVADVNDNGAHLPVPLPQQRAKPPSPGPHKITTPTATPQKRVRKELRQIPNRAPARVHSIPTPPTELWSISPTMAPSSTYTSEPPPSSSPPPFSPPGLCSARARQSSAKPLPREPLRPINQPPIGTGRPGSPSSSTEKVQFISIEPAVTTTTMPPPSPSPAMEPVPPLLSPRLLPFSLIQEALKNLPPHVVFPVLPPLPGVSTKTPAEKTAALLPFVPKPFGHVLSENKRRNPHAPTMVSMFNPLRNHVPFRAWACMATRPAGRKAVTGGTPSLPSVRYATSLLAVPSRSRMFCDLVAGSLRRDKEQYFKRTVTHCRHCKQDTLVKKHLVFAYHRRRESGYMRPPALQVDDGEDDDDDHLDDAFDGIDLHDLDIIADCDFLESPRLHDLDDFDIFADDLLGHADALELEDLDMGNHSLF